MQPPPQLNPYAPPVTEQPAPSLPLYTVPQIAAATFLASPLAGTALMALNYRRIDPRRVVPTAVIGVLATAVIFAIAFALPDRFPNSVLPAAYTGALAVAAKSLQGAAIDAGLAAGAAKASGWRVAGISLAALAVALGCFFGGVLLMPEDKVTLGPAGEQEVYFEADATRQDAENLGAALRQAGFFADQPATATLKKDDEGWLVTIVLVEGWRDPEVWRYFEDIRPALAKALGPGRIRFALADENLFVKKTLQPD